MSPAEHRRHLRAGHPGQAQLDDPALLNEVLTLAEQAKWALSERATTRVALQLGRHRQSFEISRVEFESLTAPLMDRTRRLTEEALAESGLAWADLAGVLLQPAAEQLSDADPDRSGPLIGPYPDVADAVEAAMEGILFNDQDVASTLADAEERATEALERYAG